MRPTLVLSSVVLLSLAAVSAEAQTSSNASASAPAAASTSHSGDRGYNSRADKRRSREAEKARSVAPGFAQTSQRHSGNNAGYLVPFGPPS
jgi:basic membrane lipoprotein Med (substrate-binding protein (PBP1-ABC) superfamily)